MSEPVPPTFIEKAASVKRAVDAMRSIRAPAEQAPAPNPEGAPAQAPAPEPAPVSAEPAPKPPEPKPEPAPEPAKPAEPAGGPPAKTWEALNVAERKLAEERANLKAAMAELEADRKEAREHGRFKEKLKEDPFSVLQELGWDDEKLAGVIVGRMTGEPAQARPPVSDSVQPKTTEENKALLDRIGQLEGYVIKQEWRLAAKSSKFAVLNKLLGDKAVDIALQRAVQHTEATGVALQPEEGLAMVQEELVAREKERIALLQGDKDLVSLFELKAPPPPAGGLNTAASTPAADSEPSVTSISNNVSVAPPAAPVPGQSVLSEDQRIQRAVEAMKRARGM
jgi:hypothetical protein